MSTRGTAGFRIDGQLKMQYNHFDSYPDGLGDDVVKFIATGGVDPEKVRAIKLVRSDSKPTADEIARLRRYYDPNVSSGDEDDWYCLLRATQGRLDLSQDAGYMLDSGEWWNSHEYTYIVDVDRQVLEFYDHGAKMAEYKFWDLPGHGNRWPRDPDDEEEPEDYGKEKRVVIRMSNNAKMSRGKYAAQAVHAALKLHGVHTGAPVIVLGAPKAEVEACEIRIHDHGRTELEPGTLTAGASWEWKEVEASDG